MFGLIKKIFIGLLTGLVNGSNQTKCISLSNQKCIIQPTVVNLHPNEYSRESRYYLFAFKWDRCAASCIIIIALSNKVCIPNKTEDLNLSVFNMVTDKNESKTLTKHISCQCKCKFGGTKCKSNQLRNNDKCRYDCKKHHICEKEYVCNPSTCICENGKYLASIMDKIIYDEIIESYNEKRNFNKKKAICKAHNFYI